MVDTAISSRRPLNAAMITLVAALAVLAAGPAMSHGLDWRIGLGLFGFGAPVAAIGALIVAFFLLRRREPRALLIVALVAGVAAALIPVGLAVAGRSYPRIHDISTDTADPPSFVAVVPLRGSDASDAGYDGPETAAAQRGAYPALAGKLLSERPASAYDKALAAAKTMEWQIVSGDSASGRIEAVATVPWWGYKDDVVIRVRPDGNGSRIDVRSKSRVGQGDHGRNAARIEAYIAKLG